jgi:hypothetical protein
VIGATRLAAAAMLPNSGSTFMCQYSSSKRKGTRGVERSQLTTVCVDWELDGRVDSSGVKQRKVKEREIIISVEFFVCLSFARKSGDAAGSPLAAPHRLTGAAPALSRTTRGSKRVSQN